MLVSFILVLENKHYFKPILRKSIKNKRIIYRIFFEKRYKINLTKQMQPKQIELNNLPDIHKHIFSFVREFN